MMRPSNLNFLWVLTLALAIGACETSSDSETVAAPKADPSVTQASTQKPSKEPVQLSPGKISAPISIDYSIMGNPIVGQPVGINLQISSPLNDRAITIHYRVNEFGSLTFPESQLQTVAMLPLADATSRSQQVTVVPQREGRIYLVVSAEVETDGGVMMKSMSIPIQVGRAAREPTMNGELVETPEGEVGISMPAKEP